jgi:hypothetical protein
MDSSSNERRPVVGTTEARGGVTGHNVRYVLIFGLAAAVIGLGIVYFFFR